MFENFAKLRPKIEYKFWATPGQGQSLAQLAEKMVEVGNAVLYQDEAKNRLLIAKVNTQVWGCRFCIEKGDLVITDTERELNEHAREVHQWISK